MPGQGSGLPPEIAAMMAQLGGGGVPPQGVPPGPGAMPQSMPPDEAMLDQVQQGMGGGGGFEITGDMATDSEALIALYESGDPNDPAVQEQWETAKQDFIATYGEENLPPLQDGSESAPEEAY